LLTNYLVREGGVMMILLGSFVTGLLANFVFEALKELIIRSN